MKKTFTWLLVAVLSMTVGMGAAAARQTAEITKPAQARTTVQNDRPMWDLKGNVLSCVWKWRYNTHTYGFNATGKWVKFDKQPLAASFRGVKRDAKGRIVSYSGGEYDGEYTESYKYDAAGRVAVKNIDYLDGSRYKDTYKYDQAGRQTNVVSEEEVCEMGDDEPMRSRSATAYTYLSFDAKGNWTKRRGKDAEGTWVETRTITYYK